METHREASDQNMMNEMGLTAANLERRRRYVGLGPDDVARLGALKDLLGHHGAELTATFFDALRGLDEARGLFASPDLLAHAQRQKLEHLNAMADGEYGLAYVEQRVRLARIYSRVGLDARVFLGAFHALLKAIGAAVMKRPLRTPLEGCEDLMSLEKVAFFDIAIIIDVLSFERERVIRQQQEAIRELSTPVLQIRDRMLLLPIIGVIDTHRARLITESLLRAIRSSRAKVVVMDVTGVATIDSKVANHLLQTVSAARLMGAIVIVTGLSSDVAQSLVALGIEVARFNTVGDLQGGVEEAERIFGYRLVRGAPAPADLDGDVE